jgi:hypothetical protein
MNDQQVHTLPVTTRQTINQGGDQNPLKKTGGNAENPTIE